LGELRICVLTLRHLRDGGTRRAPTRIRSAGLLCQCFGRALAAWRGGTLHPVKIPQFLQLALSLPPVLPRLPSNKRRRTLALRPERAVTKARNQYGTPGQASSPAPPAPPRADHRPSS